MEYKKIKKQIEDFPESVDWNKKAITFAFEQGTINQEQKNELLVLISKVSGLQQDESTLKRKKFMMSDFRNFKEIEEHIDAILRENNYKDYSIVFELIAQVVGLDFISQSPMEYDISVEDLIARLDPQTRYEIERSLVMIAFYMPIRFINDSIFSSLERLYQVRKNEVQLSREDVIVYAINKERETGNSYDLSEVPFFNIGINPFVQRSYALIRFGAVVHEEVRKMLSYLLARNKSLSCADLCEKLNFSIFHDLTLAEIGGRQSRDPLLSLFKEYKNQAGSQYQYVEEENFVTLQNYTIFFNHQYDITTTVRVFDPGSGMHDRQGSVPGIKDCETYFMCQLGAVLANITKEGGISIHIDVNKVMDNDKILSYLGFKKLEFPVDSAVVLRRVGSHIHTFEEFDKWYREHMN